jgi:hypothetical protein
MPGAREVRLGIDRAEDRVGRDAGIEPFDARLEEGHAAGSFVEGRLVGDLRESRDSGRRIETTVAQPRAVVSGSGVFDCSSDVLRLFLSWVRLRGSGGSM